jgi:hypothetical protein
MKQFKGNIAWCNISQSETTQFRCRQVVTHVFNSNEIDSISHNNKGFNGLNLEWKNRERRFAGAICIPVSCPSSTVSSLMQHLFDGTDLKMSTDYNQENFCKFRQTNNLQVIDYATM